MTHDTRPLSGSLPDDVAAAVLDELARARYKFAAFNSAHEGWAVIREEVDEMWDEVKANRADLACEEAIQVAAMAIRFVVDLGKHDR